MELSKLIKIVYDIPDEMPRNDEYIGRHSLDGEIKVGHVLNEFTYYFVTRWTEIAHKKREVVFIVSDRGDGSFESICLPANEDILPIMKKIGKLCKVSDEIENIMESTGYKS